ncbi:Fic family protein [Paenibacillus humicus]|uniref:Fic family protein n=1 Tax=Paenibacillus humicus TaxID=412861 RepID=UPI003F140543
MKAKYHMTTEQNIFVAKRNIIDYIWKSAKLEGFAVTYPDTEAIFNGLSVPGIKVNEIVGVNNLKHAWQFILDNLDYPIDLTYICKINQLVGGDNLIVQAGYLRKVPVSIGGTTWRPDMPDDLQIKEELAEILTLESPTDRAITLMLYLMRKQMFLDGNKRTAMLSGNQVMISAGTGIITIPIEHQRTFTGLLVDYYETNDMEAIKTFIYDYCIDGIQFDPVQEQDEPEFER